MGSVLSFLISESSIATAEVPKEEQKVYVCLPPTYDEGKHILSWALTHFQKDQTKFIATSIIPTYYNCPGFCEFVYSLLMLLQSFSFYSKSIVDHILKF